MDTMQIIVTIAGVALLGGTLWFFFGKRPEHHGKEKGKLYACPMHPAVRSDRPGTAPCCGMEFVPVYAGQETAEASDGAVPESDGTIRISPAKQQIIGVRTGVAEVTQATGTRRRHIVHVAARANLPIAC